MSKPIVFVFDGKRVSINIVELVCISKIIAFVFVGKGVNINKLICIFKTLALAFDRERVNNNVELGCIS